MQGKRKPAFHNRITENALTSAPTLAGAEQPGHSYKPDTDAIISYPATKRKDMNMENQQENTIRNETQATEIINMLGNQCARLEKIVRYILIFAGFVVLGLTVSNIRYSLANERNNQRWIEYLSQYDFVTQDGDGYNYFNSDVGGDVVNGKE